MAAAAFAVSTSVILLFGVGASLLVLAAVGAIILAVAIERRRRAIAHRLNQLNILYDAAGKLSSLCDIDELQNQFAAASLQASGAAMSAILLSNADESFLKVAAGQNLPVSRPDALIIPISDDGFCENVVLRQMETIIEDPSALPTSMQSLLTGERKSYILGIPIRCERQPTGMLFLQLERGKLSSDVRSILRALAGSVASALDRISITSMMDRELQEMRSLSKITSKIHHEERPEEVAKAALEAGAKALSADALAMFMPSCEDGSLTPSAVYGLPLSAVGPRTEQSRRALKDIAGRDEPYVISDLHSLPYDDPLNEIVSDLSIRGMIAIQLKHKDLIMGLLVAWYRDPSAAGKCGMNLCRMLAVDASVALNYSRLLGQSRSLVDSLEEANVRLAQQAIQDGLTGLANHRAFQQRLTEELHRVGRYGEHFSLVMIDVDHFKAYNDAYGHQEGDLALQRIAALITEGLRESDFAARYGGEEFAIVFPHTQKSSARIAVERIRKSIDTYEFPNGHLTVSAGIADCPDDGATLSEVIERADRALYHAKLTGRNRICLWGASSDNETANGDANRKTVRILVVENDQEARRALEGSLVQAGYELQRASSTDEALKFLRSQKFDIMLSDALILGADGMQVLGLASEIHPTMPIVLTTIPSMADEAREAMRYGVTDLLVKPFNEYELPVVIERNLERKKLERQMLLKKSTGILLQAIDALVAAIDAKDRLTAGHSARVTHISLAMADALNLPSEERYSLELAARLHDIGKLSLPDSALNKPGALTDEEWEVMQRHPCVGSQIVGAIDDLSYIATIVRHHHERLDGCGYPDGLQGEAIPFLSRIIAVADAFEALTSERSFRRRMTAVEAVAEIRRCVGTHYASEIVEALIVALKSGLIDGLDYEDAA